MQAKAVELAASMLTGNADKSGLLHYLLFGALQRAERLNGGVLSRSAVAAIIALWEAEHPDAVLVGDDAERG